MSKYNVPLSPDEVLYHYHNYDIANLEGKLLTLVDASFSDVTQREAFKDLVKQTVWKWQWEFDCNKDNHPEWANMKNPDTMPPVGKSK